MSTNKQPQFFFVAAECESGLQFPDGFAKACGLRGRCIACRAPELLSAALQNHRGTTSGSEALPSDAESPVR